MYLIFICVCVALLVIVASLLFGCVVCLLLLFCVCSRVVYGLLITVWWFWIVAFFVAIGILDVCVWGVDGCDLRFTIFGGFWVGGWLVLLIRIWLLLVVFVFVMLLLIVN